MKILQIDFSRKISITPKCIIYLLSLIHFGDPIKKKKTNKILAKLQHFRKYEIAKIEISYTLKLEYSSDFLKFQFFSETVAIIYGLTSFFF